MIIVAENLTKWFVTMECRPVTVPGDLVTSAVKSWSNSAVGVGRLAELVSVLRDINASPFGGDGRYGIVASCSQPEALEALTQVQERFLEARAKLELPDWPVTKVEVTSELDATESMALAGDPALAGAQEATAILGVSRQRFSQLTRSQEFPEPIASLAATPVWLRESIVAYGLVRNRLPGRPPSWSRVTRAEPSPSTT